HIEFGRSTIKTQDLMIAEVLKKLSVILGATILHTERILRPIDRSGGQMSGFTLISDVVPEKNVAETSFTIFLSNGDLILIRLSGIFNSIGAVSEEVNISAKDIPGSLGCKISLPLCLYFIFFLITFLNIKHFW
ncbi:hypothetical protein ACJX0J_024971, partial [Zea mays]